MTNTTKAPKVTLTSIIFAASPALPALPEGVKEHSAEVLANHATATDAFVADTSKTLAEYFVNKTSNTDLISRLLSATVTAFPIVIAEHAERAAKEEADKEEARKKAEADQAEATAKLEAELKVKKDEMLQVLLSNNFDLTVAQAAVESAFKGKSAVKPTYDRESITINDKVYEVPVKGNMSAELRDLYAASGLESRQAFIEKYRTPVATESTETSTETSTEEVAPQKGKKATAK